MGVTTQDSGFMGFGAAGDLKVLSASGNTVTVSGTPGTCVAAKVAELRRHTTGIMEFVGDVLTKTKIGDSKYKFTFDPGTLPVTTRPKVGQFLYIYCSGSKPSGTSAGGTTTTTTTSAGGSDILSGFSLSSIPTWGWIAAALVGAFLIFRRD